MAPNWTYSLLMLLAIGATGMLFRRTGRSLPLSTKQRGAILLGALSGSFIAARIPYLLGDVAALCTWQGWLGNGKTILFGLVGGYVGVKLAKRLTGVTVKTGDSFAPAVAVGIAIGRLACFQGGCCYGVPTELPWGVRFADGLPRHPTQLYETGFHLAAAAILALAFDRRWLRGNLIEAYFLAYAAYRFLTEFIRPEERHWGGLTWYQWGSLLLIGLFGTILWRERLRPEPTAPE